MKRTITLLFAVGLVSGLTAVSMAGMQGKNNMKMSMAEQIKIAESAAPHQISKDATIMVIGEDGKMIEARKGTNGFTCIPYIDDPAMTDPMCGDAASMQWGNDFMSGAPKPTNTVPGIAYMGKGGWHWEKDGKIMPDTKNMQGAKKIKEPPHWMILWPADSKTSWIPSMPGKFGTYVMYDGTPYSHLMIYQDPNKLK